MSSKDLLSLVHEIARLQGIQWPAPLDPLDTKRLSIALHNAKYWLEDAVRLAHRLEARPIQEESK